MRLGLPRTKSSHIYYHWRNHATSMSGQVRNGCVDDTADGRFHQYGRARDRYLRLRRRFRSACYCVTRSKIRAQDVWDCMHAFPNGTHPYARRREGSEIMCNRLSIVDVVWCHHSSPDRTRKAGPSNMHIIISDWVAAYD